MALDGNTALIGAPNGPSAGTAYVYSNLVTMQVGIDLRPRSCRNRWNPQSRGVLPVAIVETDGFDVSQIDLSSIEIARADGTGGSAQLMNWPIGPPARLRDIVGEADDDLCGCHSEGPDGNSDLLVAFRSTEITEALDLTMLSPFPVELVVRGRLRDGSEFEGRDCLNVVVPPAERRPGGVPRERSG